MSLSSIGVLLGLGLAGLVSARFEGAVATGILGGYLFGASIGLLAAAWMRHSIRSDSRRAMRSLLEGFFMKFSGLLLAAFTLRYVPAAGNVADWRAFLVAYVVAAVLALLLTTLEITRNWKSRDTKRLRGETAL